MSTAAGPLASLTVLELPGTLATSIAGGALADLGATVVMVESPDGTPLRTRPGFHVWARGKQSIASPEADAMLAELAAGADVLVLDGHRWRRCGRPEAARVTVVVDVVDDEDESDRFADAAAPSVGEAAGGLDHTQRGFRDGPFFIVEEPAALGTGLLGVIGALASLWADAPKDVVRVTHVAGAVAMQLFSAVTSIEPTADLTPPQDGDPRRVTTPLIRFFEAADGWLVIGVVTPVRWATLCVALDLPELVADERFFDAPFAIPEAEDRMWLVDTIASRIKTRPVGEWLEHFAAMDVMAAPVLAPDAALDLPQVAAIGMRWECDDHGAPVVAPGRPVTLRGVEDGPLTAVADVGAHDGELIDRMRARAAAPERTEVARPAAPPLGGVRVLDFSTFGAGPGIGRLLAGLGADVIKVEPLEGDPFRQLGYSFVAVNAGKRTTRVDLTDCGDRGAVDRLLAGADVVVHNYRRDLADKFRLRSDDIALLNRGAVQCAVTGYGATGPQADTPAIDVIFEALTGGPLVQGGGREPVGFTGGLADNGTSLLGTVGALAGLLARRSGRASGGPVVAELSLLATTLYRHADLFVRPRSRWRDVLLGPDPSGRHAGHHLYETADRQWLLLAITDQPAWIALTGALNGLPERFSPDDDDWAAQARRALERALGALPAEESLDRLHRTGVPAVLARGFAVLARAHASAGDDLVQPVDDPSWGGLVGLHRLIDSRAWSWQRIAAPTAVPRAELPTLDWAVGR